MPCLASGACTMSGRGLWIAVPQSAAGGSSQNDSPAIRDIEHPAAYTGPVSGLVISQRSLQIELIFRLLLKITVERPHECDFDLICVRREAVKQNAGSSTTPRRPSAIERIRSSATHRRPSAVRSLAHKSGWRLEPGAITRTLCLHTPVYGRG